MAQRDSGGTGRPQIPKSLRPPPSQCWRRWRWGPHHPHATEARPPGVGRQFCQFCWGLSEAQGPPVTVRPLSPEAPGQRQAAGVGPRAGGVRYRLAGREGPTHLSRALRHGVPAPPAASPYIAGGSPAGSAPPGTKDLLAGALVLVPRPKPARGRPAPAAALNPRRREPCPGSARCLRGHGGPASPSPAPPPSHLSLTPARRPC